MDTQVFLMKRTVTQNLTMSYDTAHAQVSIVRACAIVVLLIQHKSLWVPLSYVSGCI